MSPAAAIAAIPAGTVDARQIAAALGIDVSSVSRRAESGRWPYTTTAQRGGHKRWYRVADLPADVQAALDLAETRALARRRVELAAVCSAALNIQIPVPPAPPQLPAPISAAPGQNPAATLGQTLFKSGMLRHAVTDLTKTTLRDRAVIDAALMLCVAVDERVGATGESTRSACAWLARRLHAGTERPELIAAARTTYLRPRRSGADPHGVGRPVALCQRLRRLHGFYLSGLRAGDAARYLAPAPLPRVGQRMRNEDRLAFLAHYCRPARPTVKQAWQASEPWYAAHGFERPAVDTFYRVERQLPVSLKLRARFTGSAWKALMPYRSRDVSMFRANDIWVGDGHTFKARVASPIHGKAFRPEVTVVMDWRSRKIVGWSVDLAESTLAVSAAFRDAQIRTRARPLVYYRDNGAGQTAKLIDCEIHGTLARQGIASETGIPGNPQGRGVMERVWQTVLIPFAATYPTYMGAKADAETVRRTQIQVMRDQRAGNVSALLPSWRTFLADLERHIEAYNLQHEHSALGGMPPEQAYRQHLDPDSVVFGVDDAEIHALWLPEVQRTPRRGLFELFGNKYFLRGLVDELPEGEPVRVRLDIHRAETAQVLAMDGTPLGVAKWEGNRSAAFPVPYIEHKRAERVERKVAKKLAEADEARDELMQTIDVPGIEAPQTRLDIAALAAARHAAQPERGAQNDYLGYWGAVLTRVDEIEAAEAQSRDEEGDAGGN